MNENQVQRMFRSHLIPSQIMDKGISAPIPFTAFKAKF